MTNKTLLEIAEQMAEAIREWNRAKQERESWKPVPGQVPPVGILGSAKKANAMLSQALDEYEAYRQSGHPESTVPFEPETVKAYLDRNITFWRERLEAQNVVAEEYIDAFQSVRMSLFGELLPE